ncbi:MAG: ABC transporter permease [Candidatus Aminicenantes bacterium]|nr:ABC transporter permease [Candidatus Aminicenantes bacterium]
MYKVAWRNLWRNKRRTILTISAIAFSVLVLIFMLSIESGTYEYTKDYATKIWNGKARIFKKGYFQKETITKSFTVDKKLKKLLESTSFSWCKRIDGYGLVSFGDKTYGASISGIEPEREISAISKKIREGKYINSTGQVLVGWRLAKNLKVKVGDKIAILVQGRDGSLGAKLLEITGIFKTGVLDLDRGKVITTLEDADELFSMGGRVTTVVLYSKTRDFDKKLNSLEKKLPPELELVTWQKMMPELLEMIEFDRAGAYIMYLILIMIVAFGLLNTLYMSTFERRKELAVLRAIGLTKGEVRALILKESFFLALLGTITGILISLPVVIYFVKHPIKVGGKMAEFFESLLFAPLMPALLSWKIFAGVSVIIFIFAIIMAIFPGIRVTREELSQQLRFEK